VWGTALVASVAEKVVTLEEDGQPAVEEEFSLQEVPTIGGKEKWVLPEESLFHKVRVDVWEDSRVRAVVTCKRWRGDGNWRR
jgi:hypothetical protein